METVNQQEQRHALINQRETTWYPEPARLALLSELHAIATDPARHRTRSIAIVSESNGGKSALIARYLYLHPPVYGKEAVIIPAIRLTMTDFPRVSDLSVALLTAIGAPGAESGTHAARMGRFVELARKVKLGLIFLDEFHDCAGTDGRGRPFLRCIKALILQGLCVVPVGTEDLAAILSLDSQLNTRFNFSRGRLTRLRDAGVVKALVMEITKLDDHEVTHAAVKYLLAESKGIMGHLLDFMEGTLLAHGNLKLESLRQYRPYMDVLDRVV
ncbi:TniB family NTP-binding protein [Deinococcus marmoris]|uniref:TniB family NTP-binding protein n=1 Tax=Deinococcus marmoris TaxID=249408 RepID=UPI000497E64E|nr:TniB family NTP-binding protein [Deinococcus marmoris]